MLDDPIVLLGHTPEGNQGVHERHHRHVEAIAGPDESGGFHGCLDVQRTRQDGGLLRNDAHGPAAQVGEPVEDVPRPARLDLQKPAVVDDAPDDVVHVIRPATIFGNDRVKLRIHPVGGIGRRDAGRVGKIILRQVAQKPLHVVKRLGLVMGRDVRYAAAPGVDCRPAERLRVTSSCVTALSRRIP